MLPTFLILEVISAMPFIAETSYIGDTSIKVFHLDPDLQIDRNDIET